VGKLGVTDPGHEAGNDVGQLVDRHLWPRSFAQIRVLLFELIEAFQQIRGRVLALGLARHDALGDELEELRVGGTANVAGSSRGPQLAVAVPFPCSWQRYRLCS
jgi:hypothetical protein